VGTAFAPVEKGEQKSVFTLRGATLAAALRDGRAFEEALSALGDAKSFQGRVLPVKADLNYRASTLDPLAKTLGVERMLSSGVRVMDPDSTYVGPAVTVGEGTTLLPGTILRGRTTVGKGCEIGPNAMIRDCQIGDRVTVNASQLNESSVDDDTNVGPFAYVRPNCHVGKGVKVGDFVELKNSTVGDGTKISHLTYVGDTDAGAHINFGCGTVTVNYDGEKKFRTTIGDHAFIGCNTNLVAPVTVGEGAYTAAGSTITDDVPADSLAIARDRQIVKKNWAKRRRQERT
jgi:bifunctional UDP-N-acetylglucosamine pyrophosphorylase/glucosamine-1-phosphate N-acetyltransferase